MLALPAPIDATHGPHPGRLNLVDGLYFGYFAAMSIAIAVRQTNVRGWPVYLGLHALVAIVIFLLARGSARWSALRLLHDWYPLAVFIFCFKEVARLSFLFTSSWKDHYILRLEARVFPVPPTVWLGEHGWWAVTELAELGYFSYFPLLIIVGGVLYRRQDTRPFAQAMAASVVAYFICYAVFLLFPTEGPAHTLRHLHTAPIVGGPFHWLVLLIQKHAGVHGAAFPSSHVAAGVVALIFAWKYQPRLGAALTPLVVLLCIGAVYDRYHYASDVVAGIVVAAAASVPFLCEPLRRRLSGLRLRRLPSRRRKLLSWA